MTVREVLKEGSAALITAGLQNANLDASLLLAEVLNMDRSSLIAAGNEVITEESRAAFDSLIKRRLTGECIAYILGKKEFYGLEFQVNHSVLIPRPDTETLVETTIKELGCGESRMRNEGAAKAASGIEKQPIYVLDLCTGSGAIAIALKHKMPEIEVWATDISAEALEIAQINATRLLPNGKNIQFSQGDLYDALPVTFNNSSFLIPNSSFSSNSSFLIPNSSFSSNSSFLIPNSSFSSNSSFLIILSNPPYIPSAAITGLSPEVRMEPMIALDGGDDGLDIIRRIISRAPEFLCVGGSLLLEADPRQMEPIALLLKEAGFSDIQTHNDLSGNERVISARKAPFSGNHV